LLKKKGLEEDTQELEAKPADEDEEEDI